MKPVFEIEKKQMLTSQIAVASCDPPSDPVYYPASVTSNTRTLLLPVLDSRTSVHTVSWTLQNLVRDSDRIMLLHVSSPVCFDSPIEFIRRLAHPIVEAHVPVCGVWVVGDARTVIEEKAAGADILVLGDTRVGRVKRMLLGSTSDYLVHHSCTSVVIVK